MHNFTMLEIKSRQLKAEKRHRDALNIYLYMADGDPSLDAGYLGERIAECYEALGDLHSAKYWYGRAVEENSDLRHRSVEALARLNGIDIGYLFDGE